MTVRHYLVRGCCAGLIRVEGTMTGGRAPLVSYRGLPKRRWGVWRRFWCRVRPWLADGELTLAVWSGLTPAHWADPTRAGNFKRGRAEGTAVDYLAKLIVYDRPREAGQTRGSRPELSLTLGSRPEISMPVHFG